VRLVGRDPELARLDATFEATASGTGGVVVVSGPAGIGKTSVVVAAGRRFAERCALVLTGGCPPGWAARVAYGPFLTAWRHAPGPDGAAGFS
jgi:predicted ATPase